MNYFKIPYDKDSNNLLSELISLQLNRNKSNVNNNVNRSKVFNVSNNYNNKNKYV